MAKFISSWKQYLSLPHRKAELILTIILLVITLNTFSRFLLFNEARSGAVIDDPVLINFQAIDLNALLFFAIYSSLLLALVAFSFDPEILLTGIQTYILLVIFRMASMYLIPLDPPVGCIDLQDPVVFVMGTGKKIVKDLFFSGHTSTAFLLFQTSKNKYLKTYFLLATITVGTAVILQKAHYTIDVLAGLVYSFASYQIVKQLRNKYAAKDTTLKTNSLK